MASITPQKLTELVRSRDLVLGLVFTITIFVSALLLFLVQPMFARMVLPLLGGSPAVWNTALVFYQSALLLGYGYAHLTTRLLAPRRQVLLHTLLLLAPLLVLPIGLPAGWAPPTETNPIPWLLLVLSVSVGLPFAVVSASSPLLQRWFALTGHRDAADPYFLYAASNLGSMIALLSYPLLIEPVLHLAEQSRLWALGYGLLAVLMLLCAGSIWRTPAGAGVSVANAEALPARRVGRWVLLAAVPSSLMIGVTTYISTEIASVPLLWVAPLALYLLTFILVFARRVWLPRRLLVLGMPLVVLPLAAELLVQFTWPLGLLIGLHLLAFFVLALLCHSVLAADRPAVGGLTAFYLWMSLGGVLGGAFNALLAPLLFRDVVEYPLALALACMLVPALRPAASNRRQRLIDVLAPLALGVLALLLAQNMRSGGEDSPFRFVLELVPVALCLLLINRPLRFGLGIGAILMVGLLYSTTRGDVVYSERSFFGVNKVTRFSVTGQGDYHTIVHGNTTHGLQSRNPALRREPLSYYARSGPIGQLLLTLGPERGGRPVAAVGLGAGTLACYRQPGQEWTFYEIDPAVARIARDPALFSYLNDCSPDAAIVLGDARLTLQQAAPARYAWLILDAYSSDAPPLHLLTREALAVYLRALAPDGLLVFHISNRHLDLEPVVAALARDAGLMALIRDDLDIPASEAARGVSESRWIVLARPEVDLGAVANDPRWRQAQTRPGVRLWTDDFSSILAVLR